MGSSAAPAQGLLRCVPASHRSRASAQLCPCCSQHLCGADVGSSREGPGGLHAAGWGLREEGLGDVLGGLPSGRAPGKGEVAPWPFSHRLSLLKACHSDNLSHFYPLPWAGSHKSLPLNFSPAWSPRRKPLFLGLDPPGPGPNLMLPSPRAPSTPAWNGPFATP